MVCKHNEMHLHKLFYILIHEINVTECICMPFLIFICHFGFGQNIFLLNGVCVEKQKKEK